MPPAHTSACALPSATARAACTIEASGVLRTALTGSALFAIEIGASTTSTPSGSGPVCNCAAGPNSSTLAPCAAASAAPAATSAGTQVGAVAVDRHDRRGHRRLLVVVIVLLWSCVLCTTTSLPA